MVTAICKMSGKAVTWPCSAAGCPLFGDCLVRYEKEQREKATPKPMSNEEWLKSLHKGDLANTIHAFHLGYSPWCDHHCENEGDDGCDNCILTLPPWLKPGDSWFSDHCSTAETVKSYTVSPSVRFGRVPPYREYVY